MTRERISLANPELQRSHSVTANEDRYTAPRDLSVRLMKTLTLLATVLIFVVSTSATAYAEEPKVSVVRQQIYSDGYVIVYVSGLPNEAYSPVYIQLGVWYAGEDHPVYVEVDGEVVERIVDDGLYSVTLELSPGNHRIAVRTDHAVLYSAVVYIRPKTLPELVQMTLR